MLVQVVPVASVTWTTTGLRPPTPDCSSSTCPVCPSQVRLHADPVEHDQLEFPATSDPEPLALDTRTIRSPDTVERTRREKRLVFPALSSRASTTGRLPAAGGAELGAVAEGRRGAAVGVTAVRAVGTALGLGAGVVGPATARVADASAALADGDALLGVGAGPAVEPTPSVDDPDDGPTACVAEALEPVVDPVGTAAALASPRPRAIPTPRVVTRLAA